MTTITRIEITQVDLAPNVKRSDAIQSFVRQETPFVRILAMRTPSVATAPVE